MTRPAPAPVTDLDDIPVTQRRTSAAGAPRPATTAARSVFEQWRKPARLPLPDIVVRKGVPLPGADHARTAVLANAAKAMEVGDSVELPLRYARSLMRVARRFGDACVPTRTFAFRQLTADAGGVWRTA